ncbi:MAG: HAMP domain-containing sensor histidine kinase [Caulobacteraceae bacterium]|nr:HAMP domain-containing sensor histidine kinase [Caulobacteraceae bacterium]
MLIRDLWRTTRFRLTLFYGAMFAVGVATLLGLIYWQTAGYMTGQIDQILRVEAKSFASADPAALPGWIEEDMARDARRISLFGLFSSDGTWIVGNIQTMPSDLVIGGPPRELRASDGHRPGARALAVRLPWGEVLVVGRDATQLAEIRRIILHALLWSGGIILAAGAILGAALSIQPLRRIADVRAATREIMDGDLAARLPVTARNDELDMLAGLVNAMLDEVQRLVGEVKSAGDSLAHDLRTPLTRLRALLYRVLQQTSLSEPHLPMIEQAVAETDGLLGRFRALLRVSELERGQRLAGFTTVDLGLVAEQMKELYLPLAREQALELLGDLGPAEPVEADPELLFEAVSNLLDNAIKFTPAGGQVRISLNQTPEGPRLEVADTGPGVAPEERTAVLQRFYRSDRDRLRPGSGLGLSIVAAIMRVHGFGLVLADAEPGLRVSLNCWRERPRAQGL